MKMWMVFVVLTVLCWGAYVPTLHDGQAAFGAGNPKKGPLRAFLLVGVAYFIAAGAVLAYMAVTKAEPMQFNARAVSFSTLGGLLGAIGALGIVFALKNQGSPLIVAPLVFAGAPIVNTLVSMMMHKPAKAPNALFYVGILLAAGGAAMVLANRPGPARHAAAPVESTTPSQTG